MPGRRCQYSWKENGQKRKCSTIINQYNPNPCCGAHQVLFEEYFDDKIEHCSARINTLKLYIKQAAHVKFMKSQIKMLTKRISQYEKRRDKKFRCATIKPDPEKTIFSQKVNDDTYSFENIDK